ncbi:MAG: NAD(P)H-binding protein [Chitinophagaceae bacterium]|nr:NAD(P)H-binding protein [Chitinophagaceae bacterium]
MNSCISQAVFITGGTGYIGKRLTGQLLNKGYNVILLVRKGSEHKVPRGATTVTADPFDANSFRHLIPAKSIFIQLLGVSHPSPRKAEQFRQVDLRSAKASADAAKAAGVSHFIYVSVAMAPSRLMAAYQAVRKEAETYCIASQLNCTFIRPWYVLGPGHWWPVLLLPVYGIAELVPSWRKKARSMTLITIRQMLAALVKTTGSVPSPLRILEARDIRKTKAPYQKN